MKTADTTSARARISKLSLAEAYAILKGARAEAASLPKARRSRNSIALLPRWDRPCLAMVMPDYTGHLWGGMREIRRKGGISLAMTSETMAFFDRVNLASWRFSSMTRKPYRKPVLP